jgi:protein-tyrosine phosphatase
VIDLHCHILPGVDDGSRSLEESLYMARTAVEDGIHTVVATAHSLNGIHTNRVEEIAQKVQAFKKILARDQIPLRLFFAIEVHICPHLLAHIKKGDAGTVNSSGKYLLLELPSQTIPPGIKDEVFSLKLHGITPIIVHPERNAFIRKDPDILFDLVTMGALSQVTAMSITGAFGLEVRHATERLLKRRLCHVIASDAHSADTRPPILSRAVEKAADLLGSSEEAEAMVTRVPAAILAGKRPSVPEPLKKQKRGRFWKRRP